MGLRRGSLSALTARVSSVATPVSTLASAVAAPTSEVELVAEGKGVKLVLAGDRLVVDRSGLGSLLRRGAEIYKEGPGVLTTALAGPNKAVLMTALAENRDLARVLIEAARQSGSTSDATAVDEVEEDPARLAKRLVEAFRRNSGAMVAALRANDDLVKEWLASHKHLAGIFLEGDVHLFTEDVEAMRVTVRRGEGLCRISVDGDEVVMKFNPAQQADFVAIQTALGHTSDPADQREALASTAPAGPSSDTTKACPMCAEDVKAAAKVCRFCSYAFQTD
jgi:hypothetical protein